MYNTILTYTALFLLCIATPYGICQTQNVGTIQGQVTDNQNNPLSGYTVSAVSQTDNITYAAKTNSGGQFSLTNLPAGTLHVKVLHLSRLLAQREITVPSETLVNEDFIIEGNGVVSGFLLDSISKLPLQITGKFQVGLLTSGDKWVESTFQGEVANGYFEVKNLLSGRYVIIDAFDGYVFVKSESPIVILYPNSHVGGVEVLLKPGATLTGSFVDAENGNPISGVTVRAASELMNTVYPDRRYAYQRETNTNGEFYLTVPNDSDTYYAFTLLASHLQYQTHHWRWDMSPEKNVYDLGELTLSPFLSLQGRVTASNTHDTVNGLKVQLKMHNKPADFFRAAAQPEHIVQTDTSGNFIFSELHPIEYSLTIYQNDVIIGLLEAVNPQSRKHLKIRLPRLKTLQGTVVDTKQRPIADAQLYAMRRSESPHGHGAILSTTQTDANGVFHMQLLGTKPHLLSVEASKKGYLSRVYPKVKIDKKPIVIPLQEGFTIKGHVIFPQDVSSDGYYQVNVFPKNTKMEITLNAHALNRPLLSRRYPLTESTFILDGLFEEEYTLYITGDGVAATKTDVKASANSDEILIVADRPTVEIKGQVIWAGTNKPVYNALVSRAWYPWELSQYDMSLTLDRFETEADAEGKFSFSNLTQGRYQLQIRAVQSTFDKETQSYQRAYIQKLVTIPVCSGNIQRIYLGKADGTPFAAVSIKNETK